MIVHSFDIVDIASQGHREFLELHEQDDLVQYVVHLRLEFLSKDSIIELISCSSVPIIVLALLMILRPSPNF